jgi:HK97 gp10 family phage protein
MPGFIWNGDAFRKVVDTELDRRMAIAGEAGAEEARRLCPVDTGQLRASIGWSYRQSDKTLQIHADQRYAIFVEFGTSRMPARPFLRPGMNKASQVFGGGQFSGEIQMLNTASKYRFGYLSQTNAGFANVSIGRPRGLSRLWTRRRTARLSAGR